MSAVASQLELLAPWDANRLFDAPVESIYDFSVLGSPYKVAVANPRRVLLGFSAVAAVGGYINVSTHPEVLPSGGLTVGASPPWVWLTHREHGPLVALDWYAKISQGLNSLTVFELLLREWPGCRPE